jgi:DNA-binding YbaB/EbfC family protein
VGSKGKKRFKAPVAGGRPASRMDQMEQIQKQMAEAQQSLEETTVTASAGGGAVTVEMTGAQELRAVTIQPEVVDPDDVEMLQDLIMAAFKEAQTKSQELASQMLGPLAGGMDLGGLL